jgi:hypothetical protein
MMDIADYVDFLKDVTSVLAEKEFLGDVERIHQSALETIKTDAMARRKKMSADIALIQKFDISIEQIRFQYERIKPMLSSAGITIMNNNLSDLENKRKLYVYEKRRHGSI